MIYGIDPISLSVFVATNRKARDYIKKVFELKSLYVIDVRAEDIPQLVDGEASERTVAVNTPEGILSFNSYMFPRQIGITTTEYVAEYQLRKPQNMVEIIEVPWVDKKLLYGRPVMCLLTKPGGLARPVSWAKPELNIAVNRDTEALGEQLAIEYLIQQGEERQNPRIKAYGGQLETLVAGNFADVCVDIVGTGKTMKRKGLEIMAQLFPVNLAVVINKNYLSQLNG